jgi:Fe-S-cluster containining protein
MELSRERLNALTTAAYETTTAALTQDRSAATCAALCRGLNGVIDGEIESLQAAGAGVACAPGCNFCCHLRVSVFQHEASALLHDLRTRMAPADAAVIEQRILANAQRVDTMTPEEHRTAGLACAFLIDGRCSAHDVRPSACAAYHSLSRERCERSFRDPAHIGTTRNARPALLELQVLGTALIEATQAACVAAGLPGEQVELHQGLRALLASSEPL